MQIHRQELVWAAGVAMRARRDATAAQTQQQAANGDPHRIPDAHCMPNWSEEVRAVDDQLRCLARNEGVAVERLEAYPQ